MSTSTAPTIEYPESDGRPMGETDLHRHWMICILDMLAQHYRGQQVYVSGDLLLYYEAGNPKKFIVPDAFVVLDHPKHFRRTYQMWNEKRVPNVVFETTSKATRRRDEKVKPDIYAQLGIPEYFLFDPIADYLDPPLQGHRLVDGNYRRIESDDENRLLSQQLGIYLYLVDDQLVMQDASTGKVLQTASEELVETTYELEETSERLEATSDELKETQRLALSEKAAREKAEQELAKLREQIKRFKQGGEDS